MTLANFLRREQITFAEKRLGWPAFQLRCVVSNAAMHFKKSGTFRR